jgi:gamma-glutamyltranspeptidase/glutathione hydrolase
MKRLILLLSVAYLVACTENSQRERVIGLVTDSAMVVSAHPLASRVGASILRQGGNAVDAAVATQLALAVVFPAAGNLGGGGFMVLRLADGTAVTLDYREKAPAAASPGMYLGEQGEVTEGLSVNGHLAAGVPGTVAGLVEAHRRFGSLPWKDLVQPAIDLARNGFPLTAREANGLNSLRENLEQYNTVTPDFFLRQDEWQEGDTLYLKDLGQTLERIRDFGRAGFYEGKTADDIVAEMKRGRGLITQQDLRDYQAVWRDPLRASYKGYTIITMPPPSSGGIALIQLLKSIENYPIRDWGWNSASTIHLLTEAERRVYADRAAHLGDADFYPVPVQQLIDPTYIEGRMRDFDPAHATPSSIIREGIIVRPESEETTHLSIVDAQGNAVAVTTTLNGSYGSSVVVAGSGFLLNNEMDDFSIKPGFPNMYGVIGGEANKIEPGKRMLSSMTPTIIEKNNKLVMVVGTPGGSTIITSVFQTILNVLDFNMTMQEAVSAKRVHSQWLPDVIQPEFGALLADDSIILTSRGHLFQSRKAIGRVDAILVRADGTLEGGADPRGDDTADGF